MNARILAFRKPTKNCAGCGVSFTPAAPSHRRCRRCYAWLAIARHVERAAALLREVQR